MASRHNNTITDKAWCENCLVRSVVDGRTLCSRQALAVSSLVSVLGCFTHNRFQHSNCDNRLIYFTIIKKEKNRVFGKTVIFVFELTRMRKYPKTKFFIIAHSATFETTSATLRWFNCGCTCSSFSGCRENKRAESNDGWEQELILWNNGIGLPGWTLVVSFVYKLGIYALACRAKNYDGTFQIYLFRIVQQAFSFYCFVRALGKCSLE